MLRLGLTAFACLLAMTDGVGADPITAALFGTAFAATLLGKAVSFAITFAITTGLSLLTRAKPQQQAAAETGIQLDVEVGDDLPIGFVVGTGATAGTRRYVGSWGAVGKTPNAFLTDVIQVGDLPAPGQPGLWVNDKLCTILWGDTPLDQGYPVEEFRVSGVDYLWVKYRDGSETTVDSFLLDKFGTETDREWQSDMIGRGCPHLIVTARFNRDLFSGQMQWLIEPPKTPWYDLRYDDTAGGSGAQRWADPSTWVATDNPAVIIYNLIRGVYYGDEWLYGGQNLPAFRLPASNWMAAANECDVPIDLDAGGTEKQFRCGFEVRGDKEPLAVIEELLKACNGRLAEVGGIFKILIGTPAAAVYSFTDADIIVTKEQSYRPVPTLDDTHNAIEATYPEPAEKWAMKDAPARYSATLETEDGERHLVASVTFGAAPFGTQVQRLMKPAIEEERRFRLHSFHLPPAARLLEPNDVLSWSSAVNGYSNKKFILTQIVGPRQKCPLVALKEIDPADYDWTPATDEQPTSVAIIGPIAPPAQAMSGWQVAAATFESGGVQRPTIAISFDGDIDDVEFVQAQVRLTATGALVFDGMHPYGAPDQETKTVTLNAVMLPDTAYQARGRFVPFGIRETTFSAWLDVTTPATSVAETELSTIIAAKLLEARQAVAALSGVGLGDGLDATAVNAPRLLESIKAKLDEAGDAIIWSAMQSHQTISLEAAHGRTRAAVRQEVIVRASEDAALASLITSVTATANANTAAINTEVTARADADSALSATITSVSSTVDGHTTTITSHTSSINGINARYGVVIEADGEAVGGFVLSSIARLDGGHDVTFQIRADELIVDGTIISDKIAANAIEATHVGANEIITNSANIANLTVTTIKIADAAVTVPQFTSPGSDVLITGGAGTVDISVANLTFTTTLNSVVTILLLAHAKMNYFTAGNTSFIQSISIDGAVKNSTFHVFGAPGEFQLPILIGFGSVTGTGSSQTVVCKLQGNSSAFDVYADTDTKFFAVAFKK